MRHILLTLLLSVVGYLPTFAQPHQPDYISISPINWAMGVYNGSYGYLFDMTHSYQMPQLTVMRFDGSEVMGGSLTGWQFTFDYKVMGHHKLKNYSVYFAPFLRYQHIVYDNQYGELYLQRMPGTGLIMGQFWQPIRSFPLLFEGYIGFQFTPKYLKTLETNGRQPDEVFFRLPPTMYSFGPRAGLQIGVNF